MRFLGLLVIVGVGWSQPSARWEIGVDWSSRLLIQAAVPSATVPSAKYEISPDWSGRLLAAASSPPVIINNEILNGDGSLVVPSSAKPALATRTAPRAASGASGALCAFSQQTEYQRATKKNPFNLSLWYISCYDSGASTISLAQLQRVAVLNGVLPLDNGTGLSMVAAVQGKSWVSVALKILGDLGVATVIGQTIAGNAGLSASPTWSKVGLIAMDAGSIGSSIYTYFAGQQSPVQIVLMSDPMAISSATSSGYGLMLMRAPKGLVGFDVSLP